MCQHKCEVKNPYDEAVELIAANGQRTALYRLPDDSTVTKGYLDVARVVWAQCTKAMLEALRDQP